MLPTLPCHALSTLYISGHGFQVVDITLVRGLIAEKQKMGRLGHRTYAGCRGKTSDLL
jgi:hypothetical protein